MTLLWDVSWIFMYISMVKNIPLSLYKPAMQRKASSCCKYVRIILIKICCGGELAHRLCKPLCEGTYCRPHAHHIRPLKRAASEEFIWMCESFLETGLQWPGCGYQIWIVTNRHPHYSVLWSSLSGPLHHRSVLKGLWAAGKIPC